MPTIAHSGANLSCKTLWNVELKQIPGQVPKRNREAVPQRTLLVMLLVIDCAPALSSESMCNSAGSFSCLEENPPFACALIVVTFQLLAHPIAAYAVCQRKF
jgi:hypothetical protein